MNKNLAKKFGFAYQESLEIGKRRRNVTGAAELEKANKWGEGERKKDSKPTRSLSPWRIGPVYFIFFAMFAILLARAFDLQIIQGNIFLGKAQENHVRIKVDHAPRGVIYDRNGAILAQNKPGFRLLIETKVLPEKKKEKDKVINKLASILEISEKEINEKIASADSDQVTLTSDLTSKKTIAIEASENELPGVVLEISPIRFYPYKELTSHILGYVTEADEADLAKDLEIPYSFGDKVGKAGAEQTFEETLRGTNGYSLIKVSAIGEKKGEIYKNDSLPGKDVTLSIDVDLQKFVFKALTKKMKEIGARGGSAVVMDSETGEILALVSAPSYDNNIFSKRLTHKDYSNIISNPDKPLLNRSLGASYPPGSTFKMITAAAGLETGTIDPNTKIADPGFIVLGNQTFRNWLWVDQKKTEGSINVVRAIARSTDTFFYRLGQMMGEKEIEKYARALGLGEKTGVELPEETSGLVPNEEWKLATKGEAWYPGETLNISIGQGDLLVSPLQLTAVTATFANGGKLIKPTILKTKKPKTVKKNFLKQETLETVREGLYRDTIGDGNVGWLFGGFKPKSAGKTGTAESGKGRPHAWYTAYAPHPNSRIAVTVQIEYAGHGSEECAPVVKKIFDWWFNR
jgi:penicillin-binding protein 2